MRPAAFPASLPACTKLPEALSGTKRKGLSGGKERPDRGRRPLRCHVRHVSSKKGLFRISLEEDLHPFLCFMFGRRIEYDQVTGGGWAIIPAHRTITPKTIGRNWFLSSGNRIDPAPLFQSFCRLQQDVKTHRRKVIQQYIASEEIMGTLGETAIAASVSFAALEGLTRSIISTYPDADQWLKNDLSLQRGKGIVDAIEMIARQELAPHSEVFRKASDEIKKVRNDTMHVDLKSDEDWQNAYHRWNSSQALIEILLLSKMGLTRIPNRTSHGIFEVMGKDMYEEVRQEELHFL